MLWAAAIRLAAVGIAANAAGGGNNGPVPVKLLLRDTAEHRGMRRRTISLRQTFDRTFPATSTTKTAITGTSATIRAHHQQQHLAISQHPNRRKTPWTAPRLVSVPCETTARFQNSSKNNMTMIRNLIVTTKAGSAVPAIASVSHRIHNDTRIVLLCNGALAVRDDILTSCMSMMESAAGAKTAIAPGQTQHQCAPPQPSNPILRLQPHQIYLGLTTHGVFTESSSTSSSNNGTTLNDDDDDDKNRLYHVVHAGYGHTVLQDCPDLAMLFDQAGLNCTSVSDGARDGEDDTALLSNGLVFNRTTTIERLLWAKLAANCVINPLSALFHCNNGDIITVVPNFHSFYYPNLLQEVAQVYLGTATLDTDAVKRKIGTKQCIETVSSTNNSKAATGTTANTTWQTVAADWKVSVDAVIRDTAQNRSSMLQDVVAGRRTEVGYLSGYVVRKGAALGIATPVNQEMWQAVQALHPPA